MMDGVAGTIQLICVLVVEELPVAKIVGVKHVIVFVLIA